MKKIIPVFLSLLLIFSSLSGCTVKEDRSNCPCRLIVDMSEVKNTACNDILVSVFVNKGIVRNEKFFAGDIPDTFAIAVPKKEIFVGCFSACDYLSEDVYVSGCTSDILSIPEGNDCPEVWMFCDAMYISSESVEYKMKLHKNYCKLNIKLRVEGENYPFLFGIEGTVAGYGAFGKPKTGLFSVRKRAGKDGFVVINLPRQYDNSLKLSIIDGLDVIREFAIGEYIAESGYDWQNEDLRDVDMELDFSKTTISLKIDKWSRVVPIDIII